MIRPAARSRNGTVTEELLPRFRSFLRAEPGAAGAPQLAFGEQLRVRLQPYDRFVVHKGYSLHPSGVPAIRAQFGYSTLERPYGQKDWLTLDAKWSPNKGLRRPSILLCDGDEATRFPLGCKCTRMHFDIVGIVRYS